MMNGLELDASTVRPNTFGFVMSVLCFHTVALELEMREYIIQDGDVLDVYVHPMNNSVHRHHFMVTNG